MAQPRDISEQVERDRRRLVETIAAARDVDLIGDSPLKRSAWKQPIADRRSVSILQSIRRAFGRRDDDGDDHNDLGRATSRIRYQDSIAFHRYAFEEPVWWELARFVVLRGDIGVVRLVRTWIDFRGSPTTGQILSSAFDAIFPTFSVKALAGVAYTLPGVAAQNFAPERLRVDLIATVAPLNGNCWIRLGTTPGGNELMTDRQLVGLTVLNGNYSIDLAGPFPAIPGNSTLHVTVTTADTGAGTGTARAHLYGQMSGAGLLEPVGSGSPCCVDPVGARRQDIHTHWTLRYQGLNGQSPPPAGLPVFWNVPPGGEPHPAVPDWFDARFAWGIPSDQVFLVIPGDTIVRLGLYMPPGGGGYVADYYGWFGGRLQGYTQADHSGAALRNVRHGWTW